MRRETQLRPPKLAILVNRFTLKLSNMSDGQVDLLGQGSSETLVRLSGVQLWRSEIGTPGYSIRVVPHF